MNAGQISALLMVAAVAGCVGSNADAPAAAQPSATVVVQEGALEAGSILGTVVDDSNSPVEAALVLVQEVDARATTDAAGSFAVNNVDPGTYTVFVSKLGYESAAKRVDVAAYETSAVTFRLVPIAIAEPYSELIIKVMEILVGFSWSIGGDFNNGCIVPGVTCQGAAVSTLQPLNGPNARFVLEEPDHIPLATIIIEEDWIPNSAICAKAINVGIYNPDAPSTGNPSATNPHYWTNDPHPEFDITPPIWIRIPRVEEGNPDAIDDPTRVERNDNDTLEVSGNWTLRNFPPGRGLTNLPADFNCFTQQKVDIYWTNFFLDPAPLSYSGRPDA